MSEVRFRLELDYVCDLIRQKAREVILIGGNEEDLKERIEQVLRKEVWDALNIPEPRYEFKIESGVVAKHWGRIDALYGLCIFEYKKPGELKKASVREEAVEKMKSTYIPGLLKAFNTRKHIQSIRRMGYIPVLTGVIWDGFNVIFVEYDDSSKQFRCSGLQSLNPETLRNIVARVIATYRKRIDPRALASDFGYRSRTAKEAVREFYNKLLNPGEKASKLFNEWVKLTSQAYSLSGEELKKIAKDYGFSEREAQGLDGLRLFFAIQTYYALIIKLLAVEVAARFYDSTLSSFFSEVEKATDLREVMERLENGWYYRFFKIQNFLEGEFFSWYIDEWDDNIRKVVRNIIDTLMEEYSVESIAYNPVAARDVFKLLYEELVPRKEVRKKLGIYTTPDWLAELIIEEVFLAKSERRDLLKCRFLDPGCGTGTFLSILIKKLVEIGKEENIDSRNTLKMICSNVMGFDLDCLAVLTARANYLIALASEGLLGHKIEAIEIPVYLANSIITAKEFEDTIAVNGKPVKVMKIEAGGETFYIPSRAIPKALNLLSDLGMFLDAEIPFDAPNFQKEIEKYGLTEEEKETIKDCYSKLMEFKKRNVDSVWIPILKTHLVSTYYKGFDFILGNPPWIPYRYLPSDYQVKIKELIKDVYGLVSEEHLITHMEMATLFLVRCLDIYLNEGGYLGFVMPKSIMYSDQHNNFRLQNVSVGYKLEKFIDCRVKPLFYVPACATIVRKNEGEVAKEVSTIVVEGRLPEDRHKVMSWAEAKNKLRVDENRKLHLNMIGSRSFFSERKVETISGKSYYYGGFYQGATIVPQSCWFVDIIGESNGEVLVKTSRRAGIRGKYADNIPLLPIERDFLYYALTSAEILPFCHLEPNTVVLPIIPSRSKYILLDKEKAKYGGYIRLVEWLTRAEKIWAKSKSSKKMSLYERIDYQHLLTNQNPNAKYIIVYLRSATHLASCVIYNEDWKEKSGLKKPIIIESTLYRFFTNNHDEAYYLAAILNSSILDALIKPMQTKGFSGAERDIHKKPLEFPIPKFNGNDSLHVQLSELGKKATEKAYEILPRILKEKGYDEKLQERGTLVPTEVANLRTSIREEIKDLLDQVDELVLNLLSNTKTDTGTKLDMFTLSKNPQKTA